MAIIVYLYWTQSTIEGIYARTVPTPHKGIDVRRKDNTIARLEVGSFIYQKSALHKH